MGEYLSPNSGVIVSSDLMPHIPAARTSLESEGKNILITTMGTTNPDAEKNTQLDDLEKPLPENFTRVWISDHAEKILATAQSLRDAHKESAA